MKTAAAGFVDKFSEGTDFVGMLTFASSSYYMDFPIASSFKTSTPTLPSVISSIVCVGRTSSAMGLWNGYTALANLNQPGALNVIVFFTDGNPTAITGQFPIQAASACNNTLKAQAAGVFGVLTYGGSNPWGLIKPQISGQPMPDTTLENKGEAVDGLTGTSTSGCSFYNDTSPTAVSSSDLSGLPATNTDYYGNSLFGDFSPVNITTTAGIDNAATNAAINAANRIRGGAVVNKISPGAPASAIGKSVSNVVIFAIGISAVDATFMKRVANAPNVVTDPNPYWDSSQQTGFYKYCNTTDDLQDAFDQVAAEVLRLSK